MYYIGQMGYFGGFWMVLFWIAFIWLVVWLISKNHNDPHKEKTPLHIAKERYARGDITKKEFEDLKREL